MFHLIDRSNGYPKVSDSRGDGCGCAATAAVVSEDGAKWRWDLSCLLLNNSRWRVVVVDDGGEGNGSGCAACCCCSCCWC